jgi:hypothetical protein
MIGEQAIGVGFAPAFYFAEDLDPNSVRSIGGDTYGAAIGCDDELAAGTYREGLFKVLFMIGGGQISWGEKTGGSQ